MEVRVLHCLFDGHMRVHKTAFTLHGVVEMNRLVWQAHTLLYFVGRHVFAWLSELKIRNVSLIRQLVFTSAYQQALIHNTRIQT